MSLSVTRRWLGIVLFLLLTPLLAWLYLSDTINFAFSFTDLHKKEPQTSHHNSSHINHSNATRIKLPPKAWSLTENELSLLSRTIDNFPTTWEKLYGNKCQVETRKRQNELKEYLSSLDVHVVSHGGVGSNALIGYIDKSTPYTVAIENKTTLYQRSCHVGSPIFLPLIRPQQSKVIPTLVIVGDFYNSMRSQNRRKWLGMNAAKNIYAAQECALPLATLMKTFPTDPAGFKSLLWSFTIYSKGTVFLQAPYQQESIMNAFDLLGLNGTHMQNFTVQPRTRIYNDTADAQVDTMCLQYKQLSNILERCPLAWRASEPPRELRAYLEKEFSNNSSC